MSKICIAGFADILRAIADGKPIQEKIRDLWQHIAPDVALNYISRGAIRRENVRVKPEFILVNGIEVPAPMTEAPGRGTSYFVPSLTNHANYSGFTWSGDATDMLALDRELVHATPEEAIAHSLAMLAHKKAA